ncbi:MAG: ATP synthase F1 subunit gamma [Nitrospirae bacterium]|nr:ATP synthase F1 subunit gamma [Candidatus Manganitrophaceae bacterium]
MPVLTLREIRKRIRGAQKTQQITKTMQMVAASRLKKSEEKLRQSRPYFEKMEMILRHLQQSESEFNHPFFQPREVKSIGLVVVTSDRGLAGAYNSNVIARAEEFLLEPRSQTVKLALIGKKGYDHFRKRDWPILLKQVDIAGKPDFQKISDIMHQIVQFYRSGEVDAVYLIYTKYFSAMSIKPTVVKFLNLQLEGDAKPVQTILEPSLDEILEQFLPQYIASKMFISLVEAFTAENSARMVAMKTATDNAKEMIERLTLQRNKARQAAITKEILEIVTAGEALKA